MKKIDPILLKFKFNYKCCKCDNNFHDKIYSNKYLKFYDNLPRLLNSKSKFKNSKLGSYNKQSLKNVKF